MNIYFKKHKYILILYTLKKTNFYLKENPEMLEKF